MSDANPMNNTAASKVNAAGTLAREGYEAKVVGEALERAGVVEGAELIDSWLEIIEQFSWIYWK